MRPGSAGLSPLRGQNPPQEFWRTRTMLIAAILALSALLTASAYWAMMLRRQLRVAHAALEDARLQHEQFLEQSKHSHSIQRKIEAQLFENQQRLDRLAHHDQLTGLPNRHFLSEHLPVALEESRKTKLPLAVMFLDLDRFKHINDTHGHEIGDKLLQHVAQRIRECVRADDIIVRMGGDEFVVLLKNIRSLNQANETAARIVKHVSGPVEIAGKPIVTTASIGLSLFPRDGEDVGALLRHSDTAMYQAKDSGRNNVQIFSPVMDRKLQERVSLESRLRAALEAGRLDVHYQPLIEIETRRVIALEALVRWKDAEEGFIAPARFLPVAEETGLIDAVGQCVWNRVFADLARWSEQKLAVAPVAVNISAGQLQRCDLPALIGELTRERNVSPSLLQIELTEGAMFEKVGRSGKSSEDIVNALRALGVRIAIDDFGTGYSSLSYLKQWRLDCLKIDRSFIRDLVSDTNDYAIVSAIIAMARQLRIGVVAEGVEGWSQLEILRKLGCRYAQGYLIAEPSPADQCDRFLTGRPLQLHDSGVDVLKAVAGA